MLLRQLDAKVDLNLDKKKKNVNKILSSYKDFKDKLIEYMLSLAANLETKNLKETTRLACQFLKSSVLLEE